MSVARGCTTLTTWDVKTWDVRTLSKMIYPNKWGEFRGILINLGVRGLLRHFVPRNDNDGG